MKKYTGPVHRRCEHYMERMSECRNCVLSDAAFKICYSPKRVYAGKPKMGLVDACE